MNLIEITWSLTRRLCWDVLPYNAEQHPMTRRRRLTEHCRIDTVPDIPANSGRFAIELGGLGYRGRIVSFEPLGEAFAQLQKSALRDAAWRTLNLALGDAARVCSSQLSARKSR
jgi:hypothetical protein